jgi:hypothetical protein
MPLDLVCSPSTFETLLAQFIKGVYSGCQKAADLGAPLVSGPEQITISGVMLTEDGFAKYQQTTEEARTGEQRTITDVPETRQTTTSKRDSTAKTDGTTHVEAKDTSLQATSENGNSNANSTSHDNSVSVDKVTGQTEQIHNTADKVTILT